MKKILKKILLKLFQPLIAELSERQAVESRRVFQQVSQLVRDTEFKMASVLLKTSVRKGGLGVESIHETEFRVFSQFGEDGIIQYLISNVVIPQKIFVEFGVEDYKEANTRFLLEHDNWSGMVIDGSETNINSIKNETIYWRHDLTALHAFITKENINDLIASRFSGDIGILSIDIDGNDYWIWDSISKISPRIVICEYNSVFGKKHNITVPYKADFRRQNEHFSNLYFGASLGALCMLGEKRGYAFVGCNSAGNNAFFVRKDIIGDIPVVNLEEGYVASKFRESRDTDNNLTYVSGESRGEIIGALSVLDLNTGQMIKLSSVLQ